MRQLCGMLGIKCCLKRTHVLEILLYILHLRYLYFPCKSLRADIISQHLIAR